MSYNKDIGLKKIPDHFDIVSVITFTVILPLDALVLVFAIKLCIILEIILIFVLVSGFLLIDFLKEQFFYLRRY